MKLCVPGATSDINQISSSTNSDDSDTPREARLELSELCRMDVCVALTKNMKGETYPTDYIRWLYVPVSNYNVPEGDQ